MTRKISSLLTLIAISLTCLTSCIKESENRQDVYLNYGGELCFNRITDLETGDVAYSLNPSYQMLFELLHGNVTVDMTNIQVANGFSGLAFKLPAMKFELDPNTSFYVAKGTDIVPENAAGSYVFTSFRLDAMPGRTVQSTLAPVYLLEYTINNRYLVNVFPTTPILVGELNATNTAEGSTPFTSRSPYLTMRVFPEKMQANVMIGSAQFDKDMIVNDIVIKNVPLTCTQAGYSLALPADTPVQLYYTNDSEISKCTAENLKIDFNLSTGATTLTGRFNLYDRLGDDHDPEQSFDVTMNLSYTYIVDKE